MTNNPADAMREFAKDCALEIYLDGKAMQDDGRVRLDISFEELLELRAALSAVAEDTARLDWLDQVNTRTNDRAGTSYGWKFDINHNRAALTDHNLPALHVRAAIDEARFKSAPVKQEGKMG